MRVDHAMPAGLERLPVPFGVGDLPVPRYVDDFIRAAAERAEDLGERAGRGLFVPGDHRYAYQVLHWLRRSGAAVQGAAFLEWGSGLGMATLLAALLGYNAVGVERDPELVRESRALAARLGVRARFAHGSYDESVPGLKVFTARNRAVVYVYPWPGEEPGFLRRFVESAAADARLLLALGPEEIDLFRRKAG